MSHNAKKGVSHFRIPPDGAGKHLLANVYWQVGYSAATGVFVVGETITGQTSLASGEVINYDPTDASTGFIELSPQDGTGVAFTVGENILNNGSPVGVVASVTDRYAQEMIVTGKNNPRWGQHVDKAGAAFVRFTEGAQQLDAYGMSRMSQPFPLQVHDFKYGIYPDAWFSQSVGVASVSHSSYEHAAILDVDDISGSYVRMITSVRPPAFPGSGEIFTLAVTVGDTGKTGCVRRWGAYSNSNGMYFELSGTALNIVKRSNSTGATVVTKISQSLWLDPISAVDSNDGMVLDISKVNMYWFNFDTMVVGTIRAGVFNNSGDRITVYEDTQFNIADRPILRNNSLPIRVEIINEAATASPSRFKLFAAAASAEGVSSDDRIALTKPGGFFGTQVQITGSDPVVLGSFRSTNIFAGVDNYMLTVPTRFSMFVSGTEVIAEIVKDMTLTTGSWIAASAYSPVEVTTPTSGSGGKIISANIYAIGVSNETFDPDVWGVRGECMTSLGASGYGSTYSIRVRKANPVAAATASVQFSVNWVDVR